MQDPSLSIKKRKNSDAIKELGAGLPFSPPSCLVELCEKVGLSKYFFNREGRPSYLNIYYMAIKKDRSKYTLFLICMCVCSIAMCQNLMAPNLTEIALSYNITNELERDAKMGGSLSTAFFVFSMPFFLTIGYLTDRYDRKQLLLLVTILNAASTMCTAFSSTFFHLFLLRILSGATVMSVLPLGYSVLGDLFPPKSRGAMGTWLIVSMGAGTIVGQLMSGLLGPTLGWRTTFVFASFPGMLMTLFCHQNLMMPKRGDMDKVIEKRRVEMIDIEGGHAGESGSSGVVGGTDEGVDEDDTRHSRDSLTVQMEDEDSFLEHTTSQEERAEQTSNNKETKELLKVIFSTKTNILLFAQCIPGSIPWGVLFVFMNDFLAQDKGLTVEQATMMISLFGIGAAVGGAMGGVFGQKMYNKKPQYLSLFMGVAQMFSVPLMWRIIDAEYTSVNLTINVLVILFAGCIASMAGTNVRFLLINVNGSDTRGFVMSIFDVFNNIGRGLGPLIVSWMVEAMGSRARGYDIAMAAWWLDALCMALTYFTVEADEATARGKGRNKKWEKV